jgi:hypothetical protein
VTTANILAIAGLLSDGFIMTNIMGQVRSWGSPIDLNGSPLFTGADRTGQSEIQLCSSSAWLEAVVAAPDQLFYNTGISTHVGILTN